MSAERVTVVLTVEERDEVLRQLPPAAPLRASARAHERFGEPRAAGRALALAQAVEKLSRARVARWGRRT